MGEVGTNKNKPNLGDSGLNKKIGTFRSHEATFNLNSIWSRKPQILTLNYYAFIFVSMSFVHGSNIGFFMSNNQ